MRGVSECPEMFTSVSERVCLSGMHFSRKARIVLVMLRPATDHKTITALRKMSLGVPADGSVEMFTYLSL